jgi:signal transduction histidine kinase
MLQDCDLSLLQVHCILSKRQGILCKKERKRKKKEKKRKKEVYDLYAKKFIIVIKERRKKISQDLHSKVLHKFFSWRQSLKEQSRIRLATKYFHTHAHLDLRV